jgi:predicted transcriptional regulator
MNAGVTSMDENSHTEFEAKYLDEEAHFVAAVQRGETSLQRGEFLSHEEVAQRLKKFLQ